MASPTAIVVGAGAGGVAVAARLANNGFQVTVVEKNGDIGGRCSLLHQNGYRFDQGPSLLLMPEYFHGIFHDLDTSLAAEGIDLLKCEPNYRIWFADHDTLDLTTDLAKMKAQIEEHEGRAGFEGFLRFMVESGRHYNLSCEHVLQRNFPSLWSMLRPGLLRVLWSLHPFESICSRVARYFRSEKMRQALTFASMYLGMNPFEAPGTYSLLQYTEFADGIWYPAGGFYGVLDALARVGTRLGVDYRLNSPVSSIHLSPDGKSASGVCLQSGELLHSDVVVVNADLTYAYNHLLPKSVYAETLKKRQTSCSSISFYWSLDTTFPELKSHNVFLADEYRESFDAIFKDNHIPDHPSFYVHVPSRLDPSAAPAGKDAVVVLVPVGHLGDPPASNKESPKTPEPSWDNTISQTRTLILDTIEARTGASLRDHLVNEQIETPRTWQAKYNLDRGAILGLSHSFFNVLSFRPRICHPWIRDLFFVGASTHPGTGVPVCLAGSGIVCQEILATREEDVGGSRYLRVYGWVVVVLLGCWLWWAFGGGICLDVVWCLRVL
ncbi:phytoene dehydrogenase [Aspergillus heteromorphus CBS 117.55]|uniref:Phytoene desaturase n=1 Tax=Aspergillus heteromorphus CBS 117.55 TaxID=1448321 RepID=A0A317UYH3_9EURO|nr:phytoene dehydrogenase [Aspergillus heteromorphus CBS 117.55]PWY65988.1 phytoene dehydrogenase [Aspergillus heteromorphus CBS 117.55]